MAHALGYAFAFILGGFAALFLVWLLDEPETAVVAKKPRTGDAMLTRKTLESLNQRARSDRSILDAINKVGRHSSG